MRLHVYEVLALGLEHRTEVADLVWSSSTKKEAVSLLCDRFGIDEHYASVLLDMQTRRFVGEQRQLILNELAELRAKLH